MRCALVLLFAWLLAACKDPRCEKMFARKRARPFIPKERSSSQSRSNVAFCSSVSAA